MSAAAQTVIARVALEVHLTPELAERYADRLRELIVDIEGDPSWLDDWCASCSPAVVVGQIAEKFPKVWALFSHPEAP
jgi:hypothetical protein